MKTKFTDLPFDKQDKSKSVSFHVNKEKGTVVCRLYDQWYGIYHTGITHCSDNDVFNERIGRSIAFNKARRKELEYNLKQIECERENIERWYQSAMAELEDRTHINIVYLTGVNDDLKDLIGD